jgi:hypothetical protein
MNALLVISTLNYSTPHNVWQPVLMGILTMQESVSNAIHPASNAINLVPQLVPSVMEL